MGDRVVGVLLLAATGQAGSLAIGGDGSSGQKDQAFLILSCLTKLEGCLTVRHWLLDLANRCLGHGGACEYKFQ